ncbi:hypothetical protein CPB84DRAFT_1882361 [Gymnopilus junonius]|uniref:Cytochrome b561 domain-containing protein n=1 Tax=Gymnopilus junonius TaxID=109634 RepID=A0A9P5NU96_GYMJU|nr:hypothetical protein CPB84DRAFT_1882361 [Gymnopilus junonius]
MCIRAVVNGSSTNYILSSLGNLNLGWMAMGFGQQMPDTPMVIMWINNDGSVTLSQRSAAAEVMPTVDSSPPRKAVKVSGLTISSAAQLAFSVPSNSDTKQPVIFAIGTTNPGSSAEDATLNQHTDYGILQLDLAKQINNSDPGNLPPTGSSDSFSPLLPYQRLIVAHAIFCTVGFLLFLPAGALLARYLRNFLPTTWFQTHWIVQFVIAGPTILIGVILGIESVAEAKAFHLNDTHKKWGIAIFILYLAQCAFGAFVHFIKKKDRKRRPPKNYLHAILGLAIIGLALYQVHSGYHYEWPSTTGRKPLPKVVGIIFWVWLVFLPLAYFAGLGFLPKQYRQESRKAIVNDEDDNGNLFNLKQTAYPRR